ncbi:hypothetical protein B0H14DRAFT_2617322 [Mycena olivaceomarginata]|nr:hypothetical protein B0H14DRAFT_2617322 [Mycena olivaceomarginata]
MPVAQKIGNGHVTVLGSLRPYNFIQEGSFGCGTPVEDSVKLSELRSQSENRACFGGPTGGSATEKVRECAVNLLGYKIPEELDGKVGNIVCVRKEMMNEVQRRVIYGSTALKVDCTDGTQKIKIKTVIMVQNSWQYNYEVHERGMEPPAGSIPEGSERNGIHDPTSWQRRRRTYYPSKTMRNGWLFLMEGWEHASGKDDD